MPVPSDYKYSKTHEWVKIEDDTVTVGITDHAQEELGDITYVELPEPGRVLALDERFGTVESVKAVSDLFSPVSGEVVEINRLLTDAAEVVNEDAYNRGWMLRIRLSNPAELEELLDAADYDRFVEESSH